MKTVIPLFIFLFFSISTNSQTTLQESEKIATFCKLWGFLKYYHPTVAKGKLDWDKEFMTRIKVVTSLNSKQEINNYYSEWIASLGNIKNCKKCKNEIPDSLKRNLDLVWINDSTLFSKKLIAQLEFIKQNRNQRKNYYVHRNLLIETPCFHNEKIYKDSIFPSPELRLLGLSRYWNIVNYFFPYKYAIGQDWNNILIEMIPKLIDAKDTLNYYQTMSELTTRINDGHGWFVSDYLDQSSDQFWGTKMVPFYTALIENNAIIKGFYNDSLCKSYDIQKGDVILKMNNKDLKDRIMEDYKYTGGSNEAARMSDVKMNLFNGKTDSVLITFERNGTQSQKYIPRRNFRDFNYNPRNSNEEPGQILNGNIGYVDLSILKRKQVRKVMKKLKNTKAIIFDDRTYPQGVMYKISKYLNPQKRPFSIFTYPDLTYPGIFQYTKMMTCGKKNSSFYKGRVILLFNETSQSHAEFTLMALQTAPNVTCIGSHTAGADGNIVFIPMPGNTKASMSSLGVYYPDGRETQRIGIVPDIEVIPTIEGIKSGKDELLEKAIEIINGK